MTQRINACTVYVHEILYYDYHKFWNFWNNNKLKNETRIR